MCVDNGGFGFGTPAQRQRQYQKKRAIEASETVYEHRVGKVVGQAEDRLVTLERKRVKKQQVRNQIERLVEDLIQESISKGDFDNLAGKGQPLPNKVDYNPYTDFTTHKMNQILVETGFAPEWVSLQKEIRLQVEDVRAEMTLARLHDSVRREFQIQYPGHDPAYLRYRQDTFCLDLYTTVVPTSLEGRGVAKLLANAAFDHMVSQDLKVKLSCWYLAGYLKRNPREDVRSLLVTG